MSLDVIAIVRVIFDARCGFVMMRYFDEDLILISYEISLIRQDSAVMQNSAVKPPP